MVVGALQNAPGSPVVQVAIGIMVCAGITGSGSGGVGLAMGQLGGHFSNLGVNPQVIHRLVAIGSCTLDSLPHSGALQTFVAVNRLPLGSFYYVIFILSVVITTIVLVFATFLASLGVV
jgi:H+/gluconate symporter-like permease